MPDATRTLLGFDPARLKLPEKPALEGLESKWMPRWEESGVYRFDRTRSRADVYAIDTPPPTVSGSLHVGHVFSFTHTDLVARFHRMRGRMVFYPMGWDDNGLPTERRVQNYYGVRCDPSLPYDPSFAPPQQPPKQPISISRPNFIELCARLTVEDEKAFEHLWKYLGLSVDWSMTYATIGKRAQRVSQLAFRRLLERKLAYQVEAPTLWDVDFKTAVAQADERRLGDDPCALVLGAEGWHPGVIGIVASRIVDRFHRPAVLVALNMTTDAQTVPADSLSGRRWRVAIGSHRAAGHAIPSGAVDLAPLEALVPER